MEPKKESRIQFLFLIPILFIFCGFFLPLLTAHSPDPNINMDQNPAYRLVEPWLETLQKLADPENKQISSVDYTVYRGKELVDHYTDHPELTPPERGFTALVYYFRLIPFIGFTLIALAVVGRRWVIFPVAILFAVICYACDLQLQPLAPIIGAFLLVCLLLGRRWLAPLSVLYGAFCLALTVGIAIPGYPQLAALANQAGLGLPAVNPGIHELIIQRYMGIGYTFILIFSAILILYALYYLVTLGRGGLTVGLENYIYSAFKQNIRQYMMIIALLGIWGIFYAITENGIFLTPRNLSNLFLQSASVAVIAIGVVLILVTMNIDLSIGSVVGFLGAIAAVTQVDSPIAAFLTRQLNSWGIPLSYMAVLGIVSALLIGLVIGMWHGLWIAYMGVPAFIVTLSSMMVFRGGLLGFTGGKSIANMYPWFQAIGSEYVRPYYSFWLAIGIIGLYLIFELYRRFVRQGYGFSVPSWPIQFVKLIAASLAILIFFAIMIFYRGIPYAWLIVLVVMVIFTFIAEKTTFGRHLYAIGGNPDAARLSGINIKKKIMQMYMLIGIVVAIGAIIYLSRLNSATANAGNGMELDCIASAVIGGTSLMGGEGYIYGGVVGALVMGSLDNGMSLMNLDATWQYIVKGLVLLLAVWVDMATRRKNT